MKVDTMYRLARVEKDLIMAKIIIMRNHGFTCHEIATIMGVDESKVRSLINPEE